MGDWTIIDADNNIAYSDRAISIEASNDFDTNNSYTFYGRYVGFNAADNREPISSSHFARYEQVAAQQGSTKLIAWRDSGLATATFDCGMMPNPFPLSQNQIVVFDEEENPTELDIAEFSAVFPLAASAVQVGSSNLPAASERGAIFLNLNTTVGVVVDPVKQTAIFAVRNAFDRFQASHQALALTSACSTTDLTIP
jgi:hypothetical protein